MTKEFLYMQFLSGVITEGEYKAKLAKSQSTKKTDLNENFVGIGAINNPFAEREKTDYEMAFDHFMTQLDEKKDKPSSDLTKKEKSAIAKKTKEKNIKEAEGEEDTIDTITMDVPLFIRMLEYAREDASQDLDLHDVTAKAVELNKDMDVLTMDSYDSIVGASEDAPAEEEM